MINTSSSEPVTLDGAVYDGNRHPADNEEHKTYISGVLRLEAFD